MAAATVAGCMPSRGQPDIPSPVSITSSFRPEAPSRLAMPSTSSFSTSCNQGLGSCQCCIANAAHARRVAPPLPPPPRLTQQQCTTGLLPAPESAASLPACNAAPAPEWWHQGRSTPAPCCCRPGSRWRGRLGTVGVRRGSMLVSHPAGRACSCGTARVGAADTRPSKAAWGGQVSICIAPYHL